MPMISLPIDSKLDNILEQLKKGNNLVLSAAPGSGKTTRLPPRLLEITDKKVIVLEPRRMAAAAAALRISEERNWTLSNEVGYQVRFEKYFSDSTRLIFLTEALLLRKWICDPELHDVGIVVLDEFHERSIYVDLALGLLKELQELSRPDLKIVVMSATLQIESIAKYLSHCSIITVPGQNQPLSIHYQKESQLFQTGFDFIQQISKKIKEVFSTTKKDILVFLPGLSEINRIFSNLQVWSENTDVQILQLHGSLSLEEQKNILCRNSNQRIILSTNVAESSVTIDGVDTVIDTGLARIMSVHPRTGFPYLNLQKISKASATQRSGRAARQYPGQCFRLWNNMDELSMPSHEIPEVLRTDLSETLLFLASFSISDFKTFSWFERPTDINLNRAVHHLQMLNILDKACRLTALGHQCLKWSLPPRLAKLMVVAENLQLLQLGSDLCALLIEREILQNEKSHSQIECDLSYRLEFLEDYRNGKKQQNLNNLFVKNNAIINRLKTVDRTSQQLTKNFKIKTIDTLADKSKISELLLAAYPDRICKRRRKGEPQGIMRDGRGVVLSEKSVLKEAEYFLAIEIIEGIKDSDSVVSIASALSKEFIEINFKNEISRHSEIFFDEEKKIFLSKECKVLDKMPLESLKIRAALSEEVQVHLPEIAFKNLPEILSRNNNLEKWWRRFQFFCKAQPHPFFSEELIKNIFIFACYGENSLKALFEKDLIYFFESYLDSELIRKFHELCPNFLIVPSGSKIQIQYEEFKPPYIEVRLQEIFGWKETPKILDNKVSLTLHLLGPNFRPVQITSDLSSFWKNGYLEVRKDLRSRYPKHSWPEDPLTAVPVAKGYRKKKE